MSYIYGCSRQKKQMIWKYNNGSIKTIKGRRCAKYLSISHFDIVGYVELSTKGLLYSLHSFWKT